MSACVECNGTGVYTGLNSVETCGACHGSGSTDLVASLSFIDLQAGFKSGDDKAIGNALYAILERASGVSLANIYVRLKIAALTEMLAKCN